MAQPKFKVLGATGANNDFQSAVKGQRAWGSGVQGRKNADVPALEEMGISPSLSLSLYPGRGLTLLPRFVVPNASVFWKRHHRKPKIMLCALYGCEGNPPDNQTIKAISDKLFSMQERH